MTHRERIIASIEHREPDRLPIDLGSARFTGIVKPAYERLCSHLGFGQPGPILDRMQQVEQMDERILTMLDVDVRSFAQSPPDRGGDTELDATRYRDEWGVVRRKPEGCHYFELERSPLSGDISAHTIATHSWPDPTDAGIVRDLRTKAAALRATGFAVMYCARFNIVHTAQYLRGFEDWYCDLAGNETLFRCLMDAITDLLVELNHRALAQVGDLIDVVSFGDDVGLQDRPVCSPVMYRRLIRPYHERVIQTIRAHTAAKILYHTCGCVYPYIGDFIDLGIDSLNPVQVRARNMQPERLKRQFGDRIAFWGGIDTQQLLPHGTPDQVREEVQRLFGILGKDGGWVLAAVHNIQPDVPPENLLAMFAAGRECGYPVVAHA